MIATIGGPDLTTTQSTGLLRTEKMVIYGNVSIFFNSEAYYPTFLYIRARVDDLKL